MTKNQLSDFIKFLQKDWQVFGPQKAKGGVLIEPLTNPDKLISDGQTPYYPFKKFFIPGNEDIFKYQAENLKKPKNGVKAALLGMNILDLENVLLYDLAFHEDPYYQQRRKNILIVAHEAVPDRKQNFFGKKFSPDPLKRLPYDVFLTGNKDVAGSVLGKKILNSFGYTNYADASSRKIPQPRLIPSENKIYQSFMKKNSSKLWQELGEKCLECGKCTLICPTCFCFRIDDQPSLEKKKGKRSRCWDSCFYHDFSQIGGGHKFLKNTEQRIHFWYEHKFLRIPREYGMLGCVGCGRCTEVCPVGIDIEKNLKRMTSKKR